MSHSHNLQQKRDHYRISSEDWDHICHQLGREPQGLEWALFSALWSEHCSYKSSKVHLKKFFPPKKLPHPKAPSPHAQNSFPPSLSSPRVLESFGENAGVIDLGKGERLAFKIESHNHPSYIEPTQGAATGVGGILRDIFTMGARPIALANYLCFGNPKAPRMSFLVNGVIRGIGGYGNCVGVPTVTGQTEFHSSYDGNILVNALAMGLFRPGEKIFSSKAQGVGNLVVYVGAKTGRDGIHGASMASESFDEESENQKPTIQIGDPFFEKLLIESCLEVMAEDLVVAIQDMGAAGLASSSFEMASRGGVGLNLHLDKVPLRNNSMTPEDILLSESQERMLLICEPKNINRIKEIFAKWNLEAKAIGEIIAEKTIELFWHGELLCKIDPDKLVKQAPMYNRPHKPWAPLWKFGSMEELTQWKKKWKNSHGNERKYDERNSHGNEPEHDNQNFHEHSTKQSLLCALSDERGTSRQWVYRQYDQRVGGATVRDGSESVGVLRLPDSGRGLGLVLGGRPYMMRFDAREGGRDAIAYPALELASKGLEPLAATNCLNFGNPEKMEVMGEFVATVEAMAEVSQALGVPVVSGNVSFYNETLHKNVTSTPATGLVGLSPHLQLPFSHFQNLGDQLFLLSSKQLYVSGLLWENSKEAMRGVGEISPVQVHAFVRFLTRLNQEFPMKSTRVVGKFGLAYTLARMSTPQWGCTIHKDRDWFGENLYEVVVAVDESEAGEFVNRVHKVKKEIMNSNIDEVVDSITDKMKMVGANIDVELLGEVIASHVQLGSDAPSSRISCKEIQSAYTNSWEGHFDFS